MVTWPMGSQEKEILQDTGSTLLTLTWSMCWGKCLARLKLTRTLWQICWVLIKIKFDRFYFQAHSFLLFDHRSIGQSICQPSLPECFSTIQVIINRLFEQFCYTVISLPWQFQVFKLDHSKLNLESLRLPTTMKVREGLERVLRLPSVASKRYLTNKVMK